jgi:hypothetical protein
MQPHLAGTALPLVLPRAAHVSRHRDLRLPLTATTYTATTYGYHLRLPLMATTYGYHLWLPLMATTYGYHLWLPLTGYP